jgi:WhiB family redox-sensing transcriptional regulator
VPPGKWRPVDLGDSDAEWIGVDPALRYEVDGLAEVLARPAWQADAACRGMGADLFFLGRGVNAGPARSVCADCVVRDACLSDAIDRGDRHGIWGGLSERERHRLRPQRLLVDDAA